MADIERRRTIAACIDLMKLLFNHHEVDVFSNEDKREGGADLISRREIDFFRLCFLPFLILLY